MTQAVSPIESSISPSPDEIEVVLVPPNQRDTWVDEQIAKHLEPALARSHGRIKIEQVFYLMMTGQAQVWFALDGTECLTVVVTEIVHWCSGRRTLKVMLAGGYGSMDRTMEPIMRKLEEYALLHICSSVIVEGRKGWERTLPDGYEFSHVAFEKELF